MDMKLLLAALTMSVVSGPALAEDWVRITSGLEVFGVDADSVRTEGSRRTFTYAAVARETEDGWPNPAHDYKVIHEVMDCDANTRSAKRIAIYLLGNGEPVLAQDSTTPFVPFRLDTLSGEIRNFVCNPARVAQAHGRGAQSAEQFARDTRSGRLPADAKWLAEDWGG
jgi:hypothetical protein